MYGTVGKFRIKPGSLDDVLALMAEWDRDFRPKVDGAVAGLLYKTDGDPNVLMMSVAFRDKASYEANADSPEQDKWFQRFAEHLDGEPEWNDGEIVYSDI